MSDELDLKVLSLIGKLSSEVDKLKAEVENLKSRLDNLDPQTDNEKISVTAAREYLKKYISEKYPELTFTNGNRASGTKFTISDGSNTINTLIRTSKSHRDGIPSGWIVLDENQIDYPITFFVIEDHESTFHAFIIPKSGFQEWVNQKKIDRAGKIHFYLNLVNDAWIDDREGLNYNFSQFYNNWSGVKEAL